jgi:very-short-patch-repair endonuclease
LDEDSFPLSIGTTSSHARRLRRDATDVERKLWQQLRNRQLGGLKFRRQATVGGHIADFLCAEKRLIVELDGGQHSQEADAARTAHLEELGYRVIRFWNNEVNDNLDGVLQAILAACEALPPRFEMKSRKGQEPSSNSD